VRPHPSNLPVVQTCKACNEGFSLDEEYLVALLGSVLAGSTEPDHQCNPNAARVLTRNLKLKKRIEQASTKYETLGGETRIVWKPESDRVDRVILKNA